MDIDQQIYECQSILGSIGFFTEECKLALVALKDANLIAMGSRQYEGIENNREFGSTAFGRLVAKHFISVDTLRLLYQVSERAN